MKAHTWPAWAPEAGVPVELWAWIGQAAEAGLRGGGRAVAVFDADGTLWAGDVGEHQLRRAEEDGLLVAPPGSASVFDAYQERCSRDTTAGYAWAAEAFAGLSEATVRACAARTWAAHRALALEPAWAIVTALASLGVEVWIVSASNRWVIEEAARDRGLPPERVIAMTVPSTGGVVGSRAEHPSPNGAGKVECIEARVGVRPILAFGNSVHDAAMLRAATRGVLVYATTEREPDPPGEVVELARAHGWARLNVPTPT